MNISVMLLMSLLIGCLSASLDCMDGSGLTFVKVTSGEDLHQYEQILMQFYASKTKDEKKYVRDLIHTDFSNIKSWISKEEKGKHIFEILSQRVLIGVTVVEELDKERLAVHYTAFSSGFGHLIKPCLAWIKKEFPHVKTLSTSCPSKLEQWQKELEQLGFVRDDECQCNEELAVVIGNSVELKLDLENFLKMWAEKR